MLSSFKRLEFRRYCGNTQWYSRRMVMRWNHSICIKTLTVHFGFGCETRQTLRSKDVVRGLGLGINVTLIQDPETTDDKSWDPQANGRLE